VTAYCIVLSTGEWRKWMLQQLIGEGIHNIILDEQIRKEAGRHYDTNFDLALRSLKDDGIIMLLESKHQKKYVVNYDKLDQAQLIINSDPRQDEQQNVLVQPYLREPEGYLFWFDNKETRRFRKQSVYNIYFKNTDKLNFAAQLITKSVDNPKTVYMGSLNEPESYISKLWRAVSIISAESKDGTFILQNLQDKDRVACGNNRQRGKIALIIFRKLGYIQQVSVKGNSTRFKLTGKKPFTITLDEIFDHV
jgi:hypothetical protein